MQLGQSKLCWESKTANHLLTTNTHCKASSYSKQREKKETVVKKTHF